MRTSGQLPDYASPFEALAAALPALKAPSRITVAEAAEKYRRLDVQTYRGPWRHDVGPYMVEPQKLVTSRRYGALAFAGPARSLKTDALIMNALVHGVVCNPRLMHVVHMSKESAQTFSEEKLGPMIEACPEMKARQQSGRGADNIFSKKFQGGGRITVGWPVVAQLSARDIPFVAITDFDRMQADAGGEGSVFNLGRKRNQTFMSLGMTVVESSPGRPILDESWEPSTIHEAPPTTGILAIYNQGTRGRFYWRCPQCGQRFEPTFARLQFDSDALPAIAGRDVVMTCPDGCVIMPDQKRALNATGVWLHEAEDGQTLVRIDEKPRPTDIVSYWLAGPPAAFQLWSAMVENFLDAVAHFRRTGDETQLKATINVDQANPYLPSARSTGGEISAQALERKAKATARTARQAPADTRFITIQIDVQQTRFVCQADAWAPDLERTLIDRFELYQPPAHAPNAEDRALSPSQYVEDWDVLTQLFERVYEVDGSGKGLIPVAIACDSKGEAGVTDRAYAFWRKCRRAGLGKRFRLVSGRGGDRVSRVSEAFPEQVNRSGRNKNRKAAKDVPILFIGTDKLKDEISAALTRSEPGPGAYHIAADIDPAVFAELSAERRTDDGWEKKPGSRRNEAFDLAVYGKALVIWMKAERIVWDAPPNWALPIEANSFAVAVERTNSPRGQAPAAVPPRSPKPQRSRRRVTPSKYMGR